MVGSTEGVMRSVALVVMEPGSEWPSWVAMQDVDVVAVSEAGLEPETRACADDAASEATTVRERIDRLGRPLSLAVLACSGRTDEGATERRLAVASTLLDAVRHSDLGHLIIHAGRRAPEALRHELIGLTATLGEGLVGTAACVSLRFGSVAPARATSKGRKSGLVLKARPHPVAAVA
jgi:hypothetical protein